MTLFIYQLSLPQISVVFIATNHTPPLLYNLGWDDPEDHLLHPLDRLLIMKIKTWKGQIPSLPCGFPISKVPKMLFGLSF